MEEEVEVKHGELRVRQDGKKSRRTETNARTDELCDVDHTGLARVEAIDVAVDERDRNEEEVCSEGGNSQFEDDEQRQEVQQDGQGRTQDAPREADPARDRPEDWFLHQHPHWPRQTRLHHLLQAPALKIVLAHVTLVARFLPQLGGLARVAREWGWCRGSVWTCSVDQKRGDGDVLSVLSCVGNLENVVAGRLEGGAGGPGVKLPKGLG
jgi:hypothetical protein